MIFIYSHSNIYSSLHRFIWNQHINQLPVDLFAQLVEHCTGIVEVMGSNPVQAWIFSGLIFTTAQVVFITANIAFIFISKSAVHVYDSYIFTVTTFVLHLWFCFVLLCDWSRKLDLRFQPIRYKNRAPHLGTHFLPVLCVFPKDNWNEKDRGWTQRVKCLCRSGIFNVYAACFKAVRTKLSHTSHKKWNKPVC